MATLNLQEVIDKATGGNDGPQSRATISGDTPGGFQHMDGSQSSRYQPPMPAPAPTAPTASAPVSPYAGLMNEALRIKGELDANAAKEQTVGDSFSGIDFEKGKTFEEIYGTAPDEEALYKKQLKMYQAEIDATNKIYDQMLNQARLEGQGRLGSTRAISARSGLLGSDFGSAQKEKVLGYNSDVNSGIQAERSAKIGTIMGRVRQSVLDEIKLKNDARQQGAENYIAYLASSATRKENNLNKAAQAFLLNGIDPTTLDPAELEEIAKEGGLTPSGIVTQYRLMKQEEDAAAAKAAQEGQFNLSEGQARYDADGNLIASRAKTYAPGTGSSASIALTPDNKRVLLGGGWSESDISSLESDVRQYGLTQVLENASANGADQAQLTALKQAYKTADAGDDETNLTRENIATFFGLADDDSQSSFLGWEYGATGKEQLDTLEETINRYRAVGYDDKEILKMMQ